MIFPETRCARVRRVVVTGMGAVTRDAFVVGEGAAVHVLESVGSVERRGRRVYAELRDVAGGLA